MFQRTDLTELEVFTAVGSIPIQDTLALRAWLHPDKKLFTFLDDEGEESDKFTYLELWQRARSVADYLISRTESGDRVLLFFPQGLDFIAAFFGCLLANRIAVPVNTPNRNRVERCVGIIKNCGANVAMGPQKTFDKIASAFNGTDAANLEWLIAEDIPFSRRVPKLGDFRSNTNFSDVAFLQYTSGSTASPKGVMVTYQNIAVNHQMMRDTSSLNAETDMVSWQPHHHDLGLIVGQLLPVFLGNHTVIMSPNTVVRQPIIWLQAISRYRAKFSGGPNFIYDLAVTRYSEKRMKDIDLSCWDIAPNGADVVRSTTIDRFASIYKKHGFKKEAFMPSYGLAEATLLVACGLVKGVPNNIMVDKHELEANRKVVETSDREIGRVLVGNGLPNWETEIAIVDPGTCRELGMNDVGEIWVSSRAIAVGYWGNEEATQHTFHGVIDTVPHKRFMRTGDIGFIGDENELYICGRLKDLIICEGRNLHPEDIEYTIVEATDKLKPQSCAVFSYDKDDQRQAMVAIIETDRDLKRTLAEQAGELRSTIVQSVTYAHGIGLNQIIFIPPTTMKKTTSGKIQRGLMKSLYLNGELNILHS